jgi:hypothetical protein
MLRIPWELLRNSGIGARSLANSVAWELLRNSKAENLEDQLSRHRTHMTKSALIR